MQYTSEDLSPTQKKITVTVAQEEAEAAISATLALYRTNVKLDGFRKGKVPTSIIESKFHDTIYNEATTDLVNVHINEIVSETKLHPISRIEFDGGEIERGKDFVYSFSFEVMPEFKLPKLSGLKAEQEEAEVKDDEVDAVVTRLRESMADVKDVEEPRKPQPGDIAEIDFDASDEDGNPVDGVSARGFNLPLGEGQTLDDFEVIVKKLNPGETGEGLVTFPSDFFNKEFANKTLNMKITLNQIREKSIPELDEDFAKKAGNFESVEKMQESIRDSYISSKTELHKAEAQKNILDQLLKLTEIPLPEAMIKSNVDSMIAELEDRLARQGISIEATGKSREDLQVDVLPDAKERVRTHVFLLTVAKDQNLTVSEHEVDLHLRRLAVQNKMDYTALKDHYTNNNLLFALRDKLLCDKAMEDIYGKAEITMVPAGSLHPEEAEGGDKEKPKAKKAADKKKESPKKAADKKKESGPEKTEEADNKTKAKEDK